MRQKKVTLKYLKTYLIHNGYTEPLVLSGTHGDFKNSLSSYIDFYNILEHDLSMEEQTMVENIIDRKSVV